MNMIILYINPYLTRTIHQVEANLVKLNVTFVVIHAGDTAYIKVIIYSI